MRLLYFATARGPAFEYPLIDGDYYDYLGGRLAAGQGFEDGPFWQPPLYPVVLAALYKLAGHDLWWPRLLQAIADAATALLAARLAVMATKDRRWGAAAGVLVALHGPLVFYAGEILPTTLAIFTGTAALYLVVRHLAGESVDGAHRRFGLPVAAGLLVGLGALLVGSTVVLVMPLALLLRRLGWQAPALALGSCLLIVATATLANVWRADEWVPISANGGVNLYLGNAPDSDALVAIRPGAEWEALINAPAREGIGSASGQDAWFVRRAAAACGESLPRCAGRFVWKARLLLRSREIPRNEDLDVVKAQSPVLGALAARAGSAALPWVVLLPLGAAGLIAAWRSRNPASRAVAWAVVALAAVPVLFFVTGRYRAPVAPGACVLAAVGAQALWAHRASAWREAVACALVLVLAVWPVSLPVDAVPFEAELYFAAGGRQARLGDLEGAARSWQQAVALRPDYLEARFNLGLVLEALGDLEGAALAYRSILAHHPDLAAARERLWVVESAAESRATGSNATR